MSGRITDADVVLGLVEKSPGLPGSWYAWVRGGGEIRSGEPQGTIEVSFKTMQKLLKVQQRLHELERRERVYRSGPAVRARTTGLGYYPAGGSVPVAAGRGQERKEPAPGRQQDGGRARSSLDGIKGLLG